MADFIHEWETEPNLNKKESLSEQTGLNDMVVEGIEDVLNNEDESQNQETILHSTIDIGPNTISFEDVFKSPASHI